MSASPSRTVRRPDGLVVALRRLDEAGPFLPAWRALAENALVDNLFFEPDFALAAAPAFGEGVELLLVADRPPEAPGCRLLALWPCRIVRRWGLPLPVLMGWSHGFAIFGAPLLDAAAAPAALAALLDAPRPLGLPRRMMMPYLPLDGPLAALVEAHRARHGLRRADHWAHARGWLDLGVDARGEASLSPRRTRQLDRLRRRLAPACFETVTDRDALGPALDDYIALETAGWKGRAGTALGQHPAEARFLHALVAAYGARGAVRIDRLRRGEGKDGKSLAASLAIRTGGTLWYLKISHDEAEARNSPGVQLVREVTRSLRADARLAGADSCAPPGFRMIESAWEGRRPLAHALIEAGGGDPLFPLAARLESLRALVARARLRWRR
ncbi:GNAT family N-acetyltransferase [Methylobacterium organophilum]|uniref:BioF2-like acetyltransferase domain-containing protein n=1 Tax=Methylobacterium organophilum TaxID=410 RepID=A0ABQ4TA80_METOR|nr:GNAT family N-acetyltransferase [Methylobacterium organophilum]GJE26962.1 hypothetical protein LKMONMHP_1816 [Methylobacterium organophilum]